MTHPSAKDFPTPRCCDCRHEVRGHGWCSKAGKQFIDERAKGECGEVARHFEPRRAA